MKIFKVIFVIAILSLALFYVLTWRGFDNDLTPYIRGDYATAARQFREAAERGDAAAQHNLALLYSNGKGVPQDYTEAMKWYGKAAEQGYASAQYNLGTAYFFGQGVAKDYVAAYKWMTLAADQGEEHARDALPILAEKLSPEQKTQAREAAQAWLNRHPK